MRLRDLVGISGPPCSGKTKFLAWIICLLSGWSDVGCLIGSFEMPRKVFLKEYLQVVFKQLQKVNLSKYKSISELPIEFIDADDDIEDITPSDFKEIPMAGILQVFHRYFTRISLVFHRYCTGVSRVIH